MKLCLISATSIFALLSASIGPAQSAVLNATPGPLVDIFDLVHDGVTSSDGGDRTVSKQDVSTSAVTALRTSLTSWQAPNFTGMRYVAGNAYPTVPLGAAAGTTPETELASPSKDMLAQDSGLKAYEIGKARLASLIGTAETGPSSSEKTGNTVFVAAGSAIAFNDGGNSAQGSSTTYSFGPGSTSTATITIAGSGNLSRQRGGGAPYVVASNSLQVTSPIATDATQGVALSDAAQPTLGYNYTPAANTVATGTAVAASFSDAITAAGKLAQNMRPVTPARVQISQVQRDPLQLTADAVNYDKLIELTRKQVGPLADLQGDGTRTLISTSVSASPSAIAALRMANVINATRLGPVAQSIEAFQIGAPSGPKAQTVATTTVADPIKGKIMASAGPLNGSLALP